jgi:amino acid transporter
MAADGVLPSWLAGREGQPPRSALLLQAALSVGMVFTQQLRDLVAAASGALLCFSALTVLALFRVRTVEPTAPRPSLTGRAAALLFAAGSGGLFLQQLWLHPFQLRVMGALGLLGLSAWWVTARRPRAGASGLSAQAPPQP